MNKSFAIKKICVSLQQIWFGQQLAERVVIQYL